MGESLQSMITLLSPFAPHVTEELWQHLGNQESVFDQPWPTVNQTILKEFAPESKLVVQINGKTKGVFDVPSELLEDQTKLEEFVRDQERLSKNIPPNCKVVFVPATNKTLLNFLVEKKRKANKWI